jgi:hypothetical protein
MARPPKYATAHDKPVSVTLRFPRDLYDEAQRHAQRRQTTLTEVVLEGVRLRLETPIDPRDILVSQDKTVMQELRQMIADEVQAALAAQPHHAPAPAVPMTSTPNGLAEHYGNASTAREHGHSLVTEPAPARKGGRRRSALGQQILDLLAQHPEGLTAHELRVYVKATKPIGDTLAGMRRLGTVKTIGQGRGARYVVVT